MKTANRTKIVCTIGPASEKPAILEAMIKAGLKVARLNLSHGSQENHQVLIKRIRAVADKLGEPVAILADLQGPRLRVGELPNKGINLKAGESVVLDAALEDYQGGKIPVCYPDLAKCLKEGARILLNDGRLELIVQKIRGNLVEAKVKTGGLLTSDKGINLPDTTLNIGALTDKDKADLKFVLAAGVDLVALSFVKSARDILDLRYLIKEDSKETVRIIAKIEKHEAIKNIDEIIEAADGVMVARGDLGLEMPAEDVPLWQKQIIGKCLAKAKPVIVATQMLDSMTREPRPTRAEVSDVANAVIDHADAVMLSNETAAGEYPVEAVATMAKIISRTEASVFDDLPLVDQPKDKETEAVLSELARLLADRVKAKAILAASLTGDTGRQISRFRPELPIFVATNTLLVQRQLNLSWGVEPFILPPCHSIEELVERSLSYLKKIKKVKNGDKIIIVAGEPVGHAGQVNLVEVKEVR